MKKGIIFLILTGLTTFASAQTITAGVKAGLQITNYTHTSNSKAALNWHAGGFGSYAFAPKWAAKAEVLLSAEGIKSENGKYADQVLYLNIPLLAVFEPTKNLNLEAGFQPGLLMSAKLKFLDEGGSSDRSDKYKGGDMSFIIGAGYRVMDALTVSVRMNLGLSEFHKQAIDSRQRVFQVSAAYDLGKWGK